MPPYLNPLVVTSLAVLIATTFAAIAFSDRIERGTRLNAILGLGAIYVLWFPVVIWLAMDEAFVVSAAKLSPVLPTAIIAPPLALVVALMASHTAQNCNEPLAGMADRNSDTPRDGRGLRTAVGRWRDPLGVCSTGRHR